MLRIRGTFYRDGFLIAPVVHDFLLSADTYGLIDENDDSIIMLFSKQSNQLHHQIFVGCDA